MRAQLEALIAKWRVRSTLWSGEHDADFTNVDAVVECADELAAILAASPETGETGWQPKDDERWRLIEKALQTVDLNDFQKLVVVGSILESRKPLSEADIAFAKEMLPPPAQDQPSTEEP